MSMFLTFGLVLFFTMLKEAYEDFRRYRSDFALNTRPAEIISSLTGSSSEKQWRDVKPGQVIKVYKDQEVPADIVLIWVS